MTRNADVLVDEDQTLSYLESTMVEIVVGEDEVSKPFFVHEELITTRSRFFQKALRKYGRDEDIQWLEGKERVVKLPDDDAEIFAAYVQLLYQDRLPCYKPITATEAGSALKQAVHRTSHEEYDLLARLYVFCEKIQDVTAKGLLISAFVQASRKLREDGCKYYPAADQIKYVFEGTPDSDPLRQLFVDYYVYRGHSGWTENSRPEDYHHDFLHMVMVLMVTERKRPANHDKMIHASSYRAKLRGVGEEGEEQLPGSSGSLI
ncbi:hypothetical protein EJ02DRAFT_430537 [Clathrospora elynae]|uniref:BTB domain-containing protein n=1 Tax=Clathrospora elynae TaxID=706981 RepID=A0A6A5T371_9PLEO|nr:hypothetical protein EJ02DRAFT_430537 [Clathrospora elynae]